MINSPEFLDTIKQASNKSSELAAILGNIESDCLGAKEDKKKIVIEAEYYMNNKA